MDEKSIGKITREFYKSLSKKAPHSGIYNKRIELSVEELERGILAASTSTTYAEFCDCPTPASLSEAFDACLRQYRGRVQKDYTVVFARESCGTYGYGTAWHNVYHDHLADFAFQGINKHGAFGLAVDQLIRWLKTYDSEATLVESKPYRQLCQLTYIASQSREVSYCHVLVAFFQNMLSFRDENCPKNMVEFLRDPVACYQLRAVGSSKLMTGE